MHRAEAAAQECRAERRIHRMIYLDYNATTPLCDEARDAMLPYLGRHFGNPSSVHTAGREARAAIDDARDKISSLLHVKAQDRQSAATSFSCKACRPIRLFSTNRSNCRSRINDRIALRQKRKLWRDDFLRQ